MEELAKIRRVLQKNDPNLTQFLDANFPKPVAPMIAPIDGNSWGRFMGNSMPRCVEIVTDMMGHAPPDDLLARFSSNVTVALQRDLQPVEGIVALLDTLDAAGVRYGVASNGEHEKMRTTLGKTGLLDRFDGKRFSAVDVGKPKPAPDLFLHAARALGFAPERTIVVEDSPLGVQGATAAGMTVIGYAEIVSAERLRAAGAVVTVERLAEVAELLGLH